MMTLYTPPTADCDRRRRDSNGRPARRWSAPYWQDDRGAATAEYAIATMAAVGFASLLVVIMQSDEVRGILTDLVRTALTVGG
jgi:Flp pilus assembly pilin Flp